MSLSLFLTKSLSRTCTGVLKGINFCLSCSLLPRVPLVEVLKWLSSMSFSPLTHILFMWRVLKWVSGSVAKSSVDDSWSEMTKLSSLYIHKGLEIGSWKELILHSLCPFRYEGLEMGSWKESNLCPFHPLEPLLCSDLLLGHLRGTLPSIFTIWLRMLGFASLAVMDFAIFLHITLMRPSLTLTGCPMMISLRVGVSTMKNWWSWKESLL